MTLAAPLIVGAIGTPSDIVSGQVVSSLLETTSITLTHGAAFTGRPGTRIHADDNWVLKLRTEHDFDLETTATKWVEHRLTQERTLGIYHPSRTWFVASVEGVLRCGNISRRLDPLHKEVERSIVADHSRFLDRVDQLFDLYLGTVQRHEMRLDEGLSNFGSDDEGLLFYLDDDLYAWDQYVALAATLAVWLRRYEALDEALARALGDRLHRALEQHRCGDMAPRQVQEHLKDQFVADSLKPRMKGLMAGVGGLHTQCAAVESFDAERLGRILDGEEGEVPVALLADIHSNLPALRAVLDYLELRRIEHILILGDTVGYGPHPKQCIEALVQAGAVCLLGNHENALVQGDDSLITSRSARWALEWSRPLLDSDDLAWLACLPPRLTGNGWMAVHGAPMDPTFFNAYVYQMTYEDNLDWMGQHGVGICFHGHNHLQGVYARGRGMDRLIRDAKVDLAQFEHTLVGPGSVGQPRGNQPGADFALYYPKSRRVEMQHLDYDMSALIDEMRRIAFPEQLIQRLTQGQ